MALNKFMHNRNIYKNKPLTVKNLTGHDETFDLLVSELGEELRLDFTSPKHLCALTKALLKRDFNLSVKLSMERLIPTIPLRLNYILWLEDIISLNRKVIKKPTQNVLDIGIGPSCIYPLLGAKINNWHFYGTEIDQISFDYAHENILANNLADNIEIFKVEKNSDFLSPVFQNNPDVYLDFIMSNPPFFASQSEALGANTTRTDKRPKPTSLSTAAQHESQTSGGEVYFTFKLAKETLQYKDRIGFATVMLGKKSSVKTLKKMLEKLGIKNYSSYEFCQGRVMRWGLAWTFRQDVTFPVSEFKTKRKLFKPMTFPIIKEEIVVTKYTDESVLCWLKEELLSLDMKVLEQKNKSDIGGFHLLVKAFKNNWIGARRKRRALNQKQNDPETMNCENTAMMVDNGNCQEETEGEEPFAKRPRCELTEEQVDESSAWNCSGLIEESTSKRPILSFTVHVNIENSPALISEALNGSESDLDCSDDQGGDEGKSKSSVEPRLLASFTLVNEHHSKDVLYQLITYIKNRIKKPVGGD